MADKARSIKGFKITNISFLMPLSVALDPVGVETMFYLRPVREALEGNNTSMDFKVCLHQRDEWIESCRGTIKVIYQEHPGEIDEGNEAAEEIHHYRQIDEGAAQLCTQSIDARALYEGWQKFGYEYGPTFQLLRTVRFNDEGMAAAEVKISQANASTAHAHVIHPTSLDAMMQLVFATLTQGTDATSTMVPTHIRKLWVSSSGLRDYSRTCPTTIGEQAPTQRHTHRGTCTRSCQRIWTSSSCFLQSVALHDKEGKPITQPGTHTKTHSHTTASHKEKRQSA